MTRDLKEVLGTRHGATVAIRLNLRTGLLDQFKATVQAKRSGNKSIIRVINKFVCKNSSAEIKNKVLQLRPRSINRQVHFSPSFLVRHQCPAGKSVFCYMSKRNSSAKSSKTASSHYIDSKSQGLCSSHHKPVDVVLVVAGVITVAESGVCGGSGGYKQDRICVIVSWTYSLPCTNTLSICMNGWGTPRNLLVTTLFPASFSFTAYASASSRSGSNSAVAIHVNGARFLKLGAFMASAYHEMSFCCSCLEARG
jgi:hypothetical protein